MQEDEVMVSSSDDVANLGAKLLTLARLGAQAWLSCTCQPSKGSC
jgi:hypothetical protein